MNGEELWMPLPDGRPLRRQPTLWAEATSP